MTGQERHHRPPLGWLAGHAPGGCEEHARVYHIPASANSRARAHYRAPPTASLQPVMITADAHAATGSARDRRLRASHARPRPRAPIHTTSRTRRSNDASKDLRVYKYTPATIPRRPPLSLHHRLSSVPVGAGRRRLGSPRSRSTPCAGRRPRASPGMTAARRAGPGATSRVCCGARAASNRLAPALDCAKIPSERNSLASWDLSGEDELSRRGDACAVFEAASGRNHVGAHRRGRRRLSSVSCPGGSGAA